jgi:hypothetical protein
LKPGARLTSAQSSRATSGAVSEACARKGTPLPVTSMVIPGSTVSGKWAKNHGIVAICPSIAQPSGMIRARSAQIAAPEGAESCLRNEAGPWPPP